MTSPIKRLASILTAVLAFSVGQPSSHAQTTVMAGEPTCCDYTGGGIGIRVCIPSRADANFVVQGLLVDGNGGTGNNLPMARHAGFREFADHFRFGTVSSSGVSGSNTYATHAATFYRAFDACGDFMKHPELRNVPIATIGCSSAGGNAYGLAMYRPERTIAFASECPVTLNPTNPNAAQRAIPGIFITGSADTLVPSMAQNVAPLMARARPEGAPWAKLEVEGMEHCGGEDSSHGYDIMIPFLEKAIARRMPANADPRAGIVPLRPIDEAASFIADDSTWTSGLTKYHSYASFPGNKRGPNTSWLFDEDMAVFHRAQSSNNSLLKITPSFTVSRQFLYANHNVGDTITIKGDASKYANWTRLDLFLGATKLKELTGGGATYTFTTPVTSDKTKLLAFTVVADGPNGIRTSRMHNVFSRPGTTPPPMGGTGGNSGTGGAVTTGGNSGMGGAVTTGGNTGNAGAEGNAGVNGNAGTDGNAGGEAGGRAGNSGSGAKGVATSQKSDSGCAYASNKPTRQRSGLLVLLSISLLSRVWYRRRPAVGGDRGGEKLS